MDQVLHADEAEFPQLLLDESVVSEGEALLVDLNKGRGGEGGGRGEGEHLPSRKVAVKTIGKGGRDGGREREKGVPWRNHACR